MFGIGKNNDYAPESEAPAAELGGGRSSNRVRVGLLGVVLVGAALAPLLVAAAATKPAPNLESVAKAEPKAKPEPMVKPEPKPTMVMAASEPPATPAAAAEPKPAPPIATPPAAVPAAPRMLGPPPVTPKYNDVMTAVLYGDRAAVSQLLELGRWVDKPDSNGLTPLMAAVLVRDADMVQLLLDRGADPNLQAPGGEVALEMARRNGDGASESKLLRAGAKY
jgi:Ankyrin repeats (many copies)